VRDEISESSSLSKGVEARNRTACGFAVADGRVAGFGVAERRLGVVEREIGVAERMGGTVDSTLDRKIGEIGSVSCAASILDLYGIKVKDV
jgi:hypothetical protein